MPIAQSSFRRPRLNSKWYVLDGESTMLLGLGIHGQYPFVDHRHSIIIAKVSSRAIPMEIERIVLSFRGAAQIMQFVARASGVRSYPSGTSFSNHVEEGERAVWLREMDGRPSILCPLISGRQGIK